MAGDWVFNVDLTVVVVVAAVAAVVVVGAVTSAFDAALGELTADAT